MSDSNALTALALGFAGGYLAPSYFGDDLKSLLAFNTGVNVLTFSLNRIAEQHAPQKMLTN